MIDNLTISFEQSGIKHTLSVPTESEGLPYAIAEAVTEVMEKSLVNTNMVLEQLIYHFDYKTEQP